MLPNTRSDNPKVRAQLDAQQRTATSQARRWMNAELRREFAAQPPPVIDTLGPVIPENATRPNYVEA